MTSGDVKSGDSAEVIATYSRAQAIEDGVLVDLRQQGDLEEVVQSAGIRLPLACTAEVFAACIELTPAAKRACNDIKGRLWATLWMASLAMRRARPGEDTVHFTVLVVRDRARATATKLKIVCGPGDAGEPVLTIMFEDQS